MALGQQLAAEKLHDPWNKASFEVRWIKEQHEEIFVKTIEKMNAETRQAIMKAVNR